MSWTNEQLKAINLREKNMLLSANAGAGKTATMVERIIQLIKVDRVSIKEMLIVTFTNAAAAEMRERISNNLLKLIKDQSEDFPWLYQQINELNEATISTIDSFCLNLVRNNFYLLGIDPYFRIIQGPELTLLEEEVLDELLEEGYQANRPSFQRLAEKIAPYKDDQALKTLILQIYHFSLSQPDPNRWLKNVEDSYLELKNSNSGEWEQLLKEVVRFELGNLDRDLTIAQQKCRNLPHKYCEKCEEIIGDDLKNLKELIHLIEKNFSYKKVYDFLSNINYPRWSFGKKIDEEAKLALEEIKEVRDHVKERVEKVQEKYFAIEDGTLRELFGEVKEQISELISLVNSFETKLLKKKSEKGVLDFADIEHFALKVLANDEVSTNLKKEFRYIFIDEYQDSNLLQEKIIEKIKRSNNLCLIGDVKQSIYRFRLADPTLFMEKIDNYSLVGNDQGQKIVLRENFRSRKEILAGINFLFRNLMSKEFGEIVYNEEQELIAGLTTTKEAKTYPLEIHLIENKSTNDFNQKEEMRESESIKGIDDFSLVNNRLIAKATTTEEINSKDLKDEDINGKDQDTEEIESEDIIDADKVNLDLVTAELSELENMELAQKEGMLIANLISQLLTEEIYDQKLNRYRMLQYKDIVILLRSTKSWANKIREVLSEHGILAYADDSPVYFNSLEIQILLNILMLIDNYELDLPLISVLRSPLVDLSEDELLQIRIYRRDLSFSQAVYFYSKEKTDELSKKLRELFAKLDRWRFLSRFYPLDQLLWVIINETDYLHYIGLLPNGALKKANVLLLLDKAKEYSETKEHGIFMFIRYVEELKARNEDYGSATILSENDNVVRIMSIHKSKGLEFPIVILSGLGKNFNLQDLRRDYLFHKKYGIGLNYIDHEKRLKTELPNLTALKNLIIRENLAEELRILYVGLTRAKEKLILIGSVNDLAKAKRGWLKPSEPMELIKGKNYLQWIMPVLLRHQSLAKLREIMQITDEELSSVGGMVRDDSEWKFFYHTLNSIQNTNNKKEEGKDEGKEVEVVEVGKEGEKEVEEEEDLIKYRFNWKYPYLSAAFTPAKLSVTEITHLYNLKKEDIAQSNKMGESNDQILKRAKETYRRPNFLNKERAIKGVELGTLYHFVMQKLNLKKIKNENEVKEELTTLVQKKLITEDEYHALDLAMIGKFFQSEIGKRLVKAEVIKQELPFYYGKKGGELLPDLPADEKILLQGVIDLCFLEDKEWVIIDYKSDFIYPNQLELLKERYQGQLKLYSEALSMITEMKVKELYLYSLYLGEFVKVK